LSTEESSKRIPSVKLFLKLWTAMLIGTAENCPISSQVWLWIQILFWALDEGYKIASCIAPQTRYLHVIQIWTVIRWLLFLFTFAEFSWRHCWDTCNACRAPCTLL